MRQRVGDDPAALARAFDIDLKTFEEIVGRLQGKDVRLDAPTPDRPLQIASDQRSVDDVIEERHDALEVLRMVKRLDPRLQRIIRSRFLSADVTLADVGRKLGISRERVRQLEEKALEQLRQMMTRAA